MIKTFSTKNKLLRLSPNAGTDQSVIPIVEAGVSCGGIRIFILSRKGSPLPEGHVGEIALDTPSRMVGYLADAKATRRAFLGKLLRTGDLGYLRQNHLFWISRVKEQIIVRGKKLDPSDFERVLFQIDSLRPGCFVVFGIDDAAIGTQRVVIISEIQDSSVPPHADLIQTIRGEIFRILGVRVDEVYLVAKGTLAKTTSGKRRHAHFRKLHLEGKLSGR